MRILILSPLAFTILLWEKSRTANAKNMLIRSQTTALLIILILQGYCCGVSTGAQTNEEMLCTGFTTGSAQCGTIFGVVFPCRDSAFCWELSGFCVAIPCTTFKTEEACKSVGCTWWVADNPAPPSQRPTPRPTTPPPTTPPISTSSRVVLQNDCHEKINVAIRYFQPWFHRWVNLCWYGIDPYQAASPVDTNGGLVTPLGDTMYLFAESDPGGSDFVWEGSDDQKVLAVCGGRELSMMPHSFKNEKDEFHVVFTCPENRRRRHVDFSPDDNENVHGCWEIAATSLVEGHALRGGGSTVRCDETLTLDELSSKENFADEAMPSCGPNHADDDCADEP